MNSKAFKLITIILIIIVGLTSCSSEYSKLLKEYESLFDNTVNLLDSEKVYESINNNLTMNLEKLNKLLADIEKNVPNDEVMDFMILRDKHDSLEEIIKKGLKWDSLGEFEKFLIKERVNKLKSKQ